jgi:hypothetical protein
VSYSHRKHLFPVDEDEKEIQTSHNEEIGSAPNIDRQALQPVKEYKSSPMTNNHEMLATQSERGANLIQFRETEATCTIQNRLHRQFSLKTATK